MTFCPPWAQDSDKGPHTMVPIGLDLGLGVFLMDLTVQAIDSSFEYDNNEDIARRGCINEELLG